MTEQVEWEHVHQCPKCGFIVRANQIDMKATSTGVITCPQCARSGPINIRILKKEDADLDK